MSELRVLAIAAASGKVGYVFLIGRRFIDWGISNGASRSPVAAAGYAQRLVNDLRPQVLVTEKLGGQSRKGLKTTELIGAVARVGDQNYLLDVAVTRIQPHANKYEEAKEIAKRWPELRPYVPRPRQPWEAEQTNMVYFEAMALAERVIEYA